MKTLTRKEEEEVLREVKQEALIQCKDLVQAYTECCSGKYLSVIWKCRPHLQAMNETTNEKKDEKRMEFLARKRD
ncbi:hypothetical protein BCR44DRAFT_1430323 [Catenaria anguillulae PL171]|uniref:COX assembly mitochondrial protein n=1 Tax=Catenaria anguillulae PL171 TaxID=765915 RepID=A0A1Y2HWG5_9FUNG|nr:hypothetical protein BCR44DRAFT_1430323 [Catenaria anguillulae PL171]